MTQAEALYSGRGGAAGVFGFSATLRRARDCLAGRRAGRAPGSYIFVRSVPLFHSDLKRGADPACTRTARTRLSRRPPAARCGGAGPRGAHRPRKAALKTRAHTFFRPMHPREATHQSSGSHAPPCSVVRFRAPRAGRPAARRSRRPNRGTAHALTPAPRCVSCSMSCDWMCDWLCAWLCDWLWPLAGLRSRAAHRCAINSAEGPHRPAGRRLPRLSQLILFLRVVFLLEVEDGALDLLRVLGAQVKSTRQILQRLGLVAELLVHLA